MNWQRVSISVADELREALSALLFDWGASGVEEHPGLLVTYAEAGPSLTSLLSAVETFRTRTGCALEALGLPEVSELDNSWQSSWQEALEPAQVTRELVYRPTHAAPAPEEENTLWFDPKAAFGAGGHPTTRLAAQAIEDLCAQRETSELELLDVGCGSGVLSLVALRSGFQRATGVDVERESVEASVRNATLNELSSRFRVLEGSANAATGEFQVLVANIISSVLLEVASDIAARSAPGALLLLSGMLDGQDAEVLAHYQRAGFSPKRRQELDGWILLELQMQS